MELQKKECETCDILKVCQRSMDVKDSIIRKQTIIITKLEEKMQMKIDFKAELN